MIILKRKSSINRANKTSQALRTGIPKIIAEVLDVQAGDAVTWVVEIVDNKKVVTVQKSE